MWIITVNIYLNVNDNLTANVRDFLVDAVLLTHNFSDSNNRYNTMGYASTH